MLRVTGPTLELVREVLQLEGTAAQLTEVPDGILDQIVDVGPMVRRARAPVASQGLFSARIVTTHTAGATEVTTFNPFAIDASAGELGPAGWPTPLPTSLDLWLLGSDAFRESGAALISGRLTVIYPAAKFAWAGAGEIVSWPLRVYQIATLGEITAAGRDYFRSIGDGLVWAPHPMRIPPGATISWTTVNAAAVAEYRIDLLLGVFGATLGQDGCEK